MWIMWLPCSTLMTVTIFLKKIYNTVLLKVLHLLNYHVIELTAVYANVAIKKLYLIQDEIKYKNYRKYYKNVIREAEVNYFVLQFDTLILSSTFGITLMVRLRCQKLRKKRKYI